jgi:hypothetical protein
MRAEHKVIDKVVDGLEFHGQLSLSKSLHPIPTPASSNCHAAPFRACASETLTLIKRKNPLAP